MSTLEGFFGRDMIYKIIFGVVGFFTLVTMFIGLYVKVRSWLKKGSTKKRNTKRVDFEEDGPYERLSATISSTPILSTPTPDASLVTAGVQAVTPYIRSKVRQIFGMTRSVSVPELTVHNNEGEYALTPRRLVQEFLNHEVEQSTMTWDSQL